MFRRVLPHDQALWFIGDRENRLDSAIHMLFMNFNIAVVWLDHDANVVDVRLAKRWHPWYIPTGYAKYILEASETNIDSFHIGDHIILYEA